MKRKGKAISKPEDDGDDNSKTRKSDKKVQKGDLPKLLLIPLAITIGFSISWVYNSYMASQVNIPLNIDKTVQKLSYTNQQNLDRYWGTYR